MPPAALAIWLLCVGVDAGADGDAGDGGVAGGEGGSVAAPPAPLISPPGQPPKIALSGEEARTTPGAAGDPFRSIESLPGVAQLAWPLALYAIRGANPGNTGFFIDGMRVPALFHFALGPSVVHPYLI